MNRSLALPCLLMFLGACAGAPMQDAAAPDLSPYTKVKVSSVSTERFVTENPIFREHKDLSVALDHVTTTLESELSGYYEDITEEVDGKLLHVRLTIIAFEPESGSELPESLPLDAALNLGAEELAVTGKTGVSILVNNVEVVDANTGEVLYFFDALGEGQHNTPRERFSRTAHSAAKDVIWRVERMSGRPFQPHRLPSHRTPPPQ